MNDHTLRSLVVLTALAGLGAAAGCAHDKPTQRATVAPLTPAVTNETKARLRPNAPEAAALPAAQDGAAIYFDSALLRDDARSALKMLATNVFKQSKESLVIEGNCDETGTVEYNLALGEERARSAKEYLSHLGVPAREIRTVSYGSTRPKDPGHDDAAHAKNRRDDIRVQ